MSENVSELFEPLRFPGDDYTVRFSIIQLVQLCRLFAGIRQNNPALFNDPETAMMELQVAHQAYLHQMMAGTDEERAAASEKLTQIRDRMAMIAKLMQQGS